jgi:general secretion pathway protein M
MSAVKVVSQLRDQIALFWLGRTEQERKYLAVGAVAVLAALVYGLFIGPAVDGSAKLRAQLPQLREDAAKMQALALEAGELARQPAPQITPMTRESIAASLASRSITPVSLIVSGDYAKLQLNGVAFAGMYAWLDALRRENRILAEDVAVTAGSPAGQVDAVLTLRQSSAEASR